MVLNIMPITIRILIIALSSLLAGFLVWHGPIAQNPAYHLFADQRTIFNLPNFWNVVSNIPFIVVGILGLYLCTDRDKTSASTGARMAGIFFFVGVLCTGLGSGYYHLQPDNWGLFWDRLAMALSFMAFLALVVGAFINIKLGEKLLFPGILFGLFSVLHWIITEQSGAGDLRLYILTQFLPILIMPFLLFVRSSRSITRKDLMIIGTGYLLAKVFEHFDAPIYRIIDLSGHTLKHFAAAFSAYWVFHLLRRQRQQHSVNSEKQE